MVEKDDSFVIRQHEQRKRKPTKRFYNEEYFVISTKRKWRNISPIGNLIAFFFLII